MNRFTDAVRQAVDAGNFYSALPLALALPDICASIDSPGERTGPRYKRWATTWVLPRFAYERTDWDKWPAWHESFPILRSVDDAARARFKEELLQWEDAAPRKVVDLFSAADLYALRCAILHSGADDTREQSAVDQLGHFCFIDHRGSPVRRGGNVYLMEEGPPGAGRIELDVHEFCVKLADAADAWAASIENHAGAQDRMRSSLVWVVTPEQITDWEDRFLHD